MPAQRVTVMAPARVMEVALVATLLTLSFGFSAAEQIIRLAVRSLTRETG